MTDMFETVSLEPKFRPAVLTEREWLTDEYVRIRVTGESLIGFESPGADDHVRLFFLEPGAEIPDSVEGWRANHSREYTPVAFDADAGWVDFEVIVHGNGVGADFAANAPVGSSLAVAGPRRSRRLVEAPDSMFLAGDETALPAINRFLGLLSPEASATVILEVSCGNRRVPLAESENVSVRWLIRPEESLAEWLGTLAEADRPDGRLFAFVAGEAAVVPAGRSLFTLWQVPPDASVAKGYWRID